MNIRRFLFYHFESVRKSLFSGVASEMTYGGLKNGLNYVKHFAYKSFRALWRICCTGYFIDTGMAPYLSKAPIR